MHQLCGCGDSGKVTMVVVAAPARLLVTQIRAFFHPKKIIRSEVNHLLTIDTKQRTHYSHCPHGRHCVPGSVIHLA